MFSTNNKLFVAIWQSQFFLFRKKNSKQINNSRSFARLARSAPLIASQSTSLLEKSWTTKLIARRDVTNGDDICFCDVCTEAWWRFCTIPTISIFTRVGATKVENIASTAWVRVIIIEFVRLLLLESVWFPRRTSGPNFRGRFKVKKKTANMVYVLRFNVKNISKFQVQSQFRTYLVSVTNIFTNIQQSLFARYFSFVPFHTEHFHNYFHCNKQKTKCDVEMANKGWSRVDTW